MPRYVPNKLLLKEFAFQLFEIGQTVELIKRKVNTWPEMPVLIGPFQILNHGHARKKGLILSHFRKLGLATLYRHEVHLDDTFFEDTKVFEDAITRMRLRYIPEERIVVLGQDPNLN